MAMGKLEKHFVNSAGHSRAVSQRVAGWMQLIPIEPGQRYLEVGMGNGEASILVARTFPLEVMGVDIDPEQIQLARAASQDISNVRFYTADSTHLPFEDNRFDIVATNKVTHHIPNWLDAMAEMVRVLKPGGYLIYSDLMFPQPIAALGTRLAGRLMGFPTRTALQSFIAQQKLGVMKQSQSLFQFEGIFRKSGKAGL